ncbi:STAS domain-containing protein [Streptomyces sp. NPDC006333]|uniref:STAS domain-containing protein n=1 Tax=Streptomyces sp. NPDC006333 TaxID=3156753 RepID=UPI0033A8F220
MVTLHGEIDHQTGESSGRRCRSPRPRPSWGADMRGVGFMDSTGINIFITAHRDLAEASGWLRPAAPTTPVLRTIQLVGADAVIDCRETLRQALASWPTPLGSRAVRCGSSGSRSCPRVSPSRERAQRPRRRATRPTGD